MQQMIFIAESAIKIICCI